MDMTKKEYSDIAKRHSKKSKLHITLPTAFLVGGLICCTGQLLTDIYSNFTNAEDAASFASVTLVFISAMLTGTGLYGRLAKHAGAGTLVPVTGFANAVVSPALEFKSEGLILGTAAKMFIIAGPVIVYGIASSFLYGVIYFIMGLIGGAV